VCTELANTLRYDCSNGRLIPFWKCPCGWCWVRITVQGIGLRAQEAAKFESRRSRLLI
jgi:hypothetical protein